MIITIDGPAGSGKSTVSRQLANHFGFQFLDTGAMYRSVALLWLRDERQQDAAAASDVAHRIDIRFDGQRVFANGLDVTKNIRTPVITQSASVVAAIADVRHHMVALQRQAARGIDVVSEGRDQGTVVFPDAECKFFLTASPRARAERRQAELQQGGTSISFEQVVDEICERDRRDETRDISPMRPAPDALQIDTSDMTLQQVLGMLTAIVEDRMPMRAARDVVSGRRSQDVDPP